MPDRTFRSTSFYVFPIAAVGLTAVGVWGVASGEMRWSAVLWFAGLSWWWFSLLARLCYRITVRGPSVEFNGLVFRRTTPVVSVRRIRRSALWDGNSVVVEYDGGRIDLFGGTEDFHEFVTLVKSANPTVELKRV